MSRGHKNKFREHLQREKLAQGKKTQFISSALFLIYGLVGIFYGFPIPNQIWLLEEPTMRLMIGAPLVVFCIYSIYSLATESK